MSEWPSVNPAFYRYIPFAVYITFIALDQVIRFLAGQGFLILGETTLYYLYPVKVLVVGYLLYRYRKEYRELTFKEMANFPATLAVCGAGLLVFFLWIQMDWTSAVTGTPQGFNPTLLPGRAGQALMTLFRVAGAVLVVPIMEELFWRSFLIRYIVDSNFEKVRIGTFTWGSFLLTTVLFGVEHDYIYAGMMAGVVYNLILYKTRSLAQCVLSHAVTNLALAVYVISTGNWQFW